MIVPHGLLGGSLLRLPGPPVTFSHLLYKRLLYSDTTQKLRAFGYV